MCYIGKATKIFIFLITVLVITGLVLGFSVLRRTIHPKSHKCSGESCYQSNIYPPPPPLSLEFPIPSTSDPGASNPSDPTSIPPPSLPPPPPSQSSSGSSANLSPPPPAASLASPPPPSANQTPPSTVVTTVPPPPGVIVAPPPAFSPPSPVPVTPGPVNSS